MLNSGRQRKFLTLVLSVKKFWMKQKTIPPPCKLNGRSLTVLASTLLFGKVFLSLKHIIVTQQMIS